MRELLRRLKYLVRRERHAAELDEELRFHLEMRAEKLRQAGLSVSDADGAARRRFGNVTAMTEASRAAWGFGSVDELWREVQLAARRLRQRPALSVPVIAVLALGIGATTAVFSAVDAAMLRALPFVRAHELHTASGADIPMQAFGRLRGAGRGLEYGDAEAMTGVFSSVAAFASGALNLSDPERPQRVNAGVVTPSFFTTLGVHPLRGRTFSGEEGKPNGPLVVVLSYGLWQRQFGGAEVIGTGLLLHGRSYQVVGVMPEGFTFPQASDLWIPLTVPLTFATFEPFRGFLPSKVVVRLRGGVSTQEASTKVIARWQQLAAPATGESRDALTQSIEKLRRHGALVPLQRDLLGDRRGALLVLLGATALLLLIACANVANLLLSDAARRRREIAVREVLGATRRRIARQLLVESVLLSLCGAAIGVLIAPAALTVLRATLPAQLTGVAAAQLDLRLLAFAAAMSLVTSLVFGLWPAFGATRGDATAAIKSGGGHGATAGGMGRVRASLVTVEIALTIVLLVSAGLMLRSFARLMAEDMGMNPESVATMEMSFARSVSPEEHRRIVGEAIARLATQPGIVAAGAINDLPLRGGGGISVTVEVPGAPELGPGEYRMARVLYATGGYFPTMGIRLLRGRTFGAPDGGRPQSSDGLQTQRMRIQVSERTERDRGQTALISKTMAERYWPGVDPIGRYLTWRGDTARMTVIGIVDDVRERSLEREPQPQLYLPIDESSPRNLAIVARGALPPSVFLGRMTEALRSASPSQPTYNVRMMEEVVSASVTPRRTNTILIVVFAALALLMSALGVYAVLAYGVTQRSREFGIRAALGATGSDIVRLVSREMALLIAAGTAVGLGAAWGAGRVMTSLLYEVEPHDSVTFLAVPLFMLVPALFAMLVPVVRAMRVNPTSVLRED